MRLRGREEVTWNIRDKHFHEIVKDVVAHLQRHYTPRPRVVVWAHNSHLGDASATDMARPGAPAPCLQCQCKTAVLCICSMRLASGRLLGA